jgi:hypothetical protein
LLLLLLLLKIAAHHSCDEQQHRQPHHLELVITQVTARDAAAHNSKPTADMQYVQMPLIQDISTAFAVHEITNLELSKSCNRGFSNEVVHALEAGQLAEHMLQPAGTLFSNSPLLQGHAAALPHNCAHQ